MCFEGERCMFINRTAFGNGRSHDQQNADEANSESTGNTTRERDLFNCEETITSLLSEIMFI